MIILIYSVFLNLLFKMGSQQIKTVTGLIRPSILNEIQHHAKHMTFKDTQ